VSVDTILACANYEQEKSSEIMSYSSDSNQVLVAL